MTKKKVDISLLFFTQQIKSILYAGVVALHDLAYL